MSMSNPLGHRAKINDANLATLLAGIRAGSDRFRPKQISSHMEILTDFVPHRFRPIFKH